MGEERMNTNVYIQYAIILVVLLIIALVVIKFHKKDFAKEVNKLVQYLILLMPNVRCLALKLY